MVKRRNNNSNNSNDKPSSSSSKRRSPPKIREEDQKPPVGKPGGRDTHYTHELGDFIVSLTKQVGSKRQAAEMAGVSKPTFYRWLDWGYDEERDDHKVFQDFRDRLIAAEEEYRLPSSKDAEALTEKAREEFSRLLFHGVMETAATVEERVGRNDKIGAYSETIRISKTIKKGVPQWAIMRQLGMYDGAEAIKTLVGLGLVRAEALDEVETMFDQQLVPSLSRILNDYAIAPAAPDFVPVIESLIVAGTLRPEVREFIEGKSKEEIATLFPDLLKDFAVEKSDASTQ